MTGGRQRTAQEWLQRLQGVLGGVVPGVSTVTEVQAVRQVTAPYNRDDGPNVGSSITLESKSYQVTGFSNYVQVVPSGYYDSVIVCIANNDNAATVKLPLFVAFGRLNADDGLYSTALTPGNFLLANPPIKAAPAQNNENSLELSLPLTNAPLIVWATDPINPTDTGTYPLTVTLMTRRH